MTLLGAFVGALTHVPKDETLLRTLSEQEAKQLGQEAQRVKTTFASVSLVGFTDATQIAAFDVVNGKLIRIRPLHYDWLYEPKDFNYDAAKIEVKGKQVPTSSLSSYPRALEIAQTLKEWIKKGEFTLTEPVATLPGVESGIAFKGLEERPIE
jgi:hypothetical protein